MSAKATVEAPANIAFVKYWGASDLERAVPWEASLSMTLRTCVSRTTVEHRPEGGGDEVLVCGAGGTLEPPERAFAGGVLAHLERLRRWAGVAGSFRVATENTFPTGSGIASSASGFAALTLAVVACLERRPPAAELSDLARLSGSGSAARSVLGGYVQWPADAEEGGTGETAAWPWTAVQVAAADHWDLRDVVAVVETGRKEVSSREGHRRAPSSPHYARRRELLAARLAEVRRAIEGREFARLWPVVEEEAIELHLIAMSSRPPIFYWQPGTLAVLERTRRLRGEGLEVCFTMDAGANVHLICAPAAEEAVAAAVAELGCGVIRDGVGDGPRRLDEHLF